MTEETQIKKQIKDYLQLKGYFHFHLLQGLGCFHGMPDLMATKKDGVVYAIEVKTPKGRQSERQKLFEFHWTACGNIYIMGGLDEVMEIIK